MIVCHSENWCKCVNAQWTYSCHESLQYRWIAGQYVTKDYGTWGNCVYNYKTQRENSQLTHIQNIKIQLLLYNNVCIFFFFNLIRWGLTDREIQLLVSIYYVTPLWPQNEIQVNKTSHVDVSISTGILQSLTFITFTVSHEIPIVMFSPLKSASYILIIAIYIHTSFHVSLKAVSFCNATL